MNRIVTWPDSQFKRIIVGAEKIMDHGDTRAEAERRVRRPQLSSEKRFGQ